MVLHEKKVIVSGGVRGLGRAILQRLIDKGASVTVFDIDAQGLDELRRAQPGTMCLECDVSSHAQVVAAMRRYHDAAGVADVLVNNAGSLYSAPLVTIGPSGVHPHDASDWDRILATDLSSVFYMTACAVERMVATRTRGVIVNISSVSAAGNAGQSAYSAAKAGVNALTAVWAKELGPLGIRVVAVAPGFVDTPSTRAAVSDAVLQETVKKVPVKRLGRAEEIADGVIAVIENDYFNGRVLELDGGLIL